MCNTTPYHTVQLTDTHDRSVKWHGFTMKCSILQYSTIYSSTSKHCSYTSDTSITSHCDAKQDLIIWHRISDQKFNQSSPIANKNKWHDELRTPELLDCVCMLAICYYLLPHATLLCIKISDIPNLPSAIQ